MWRKVYPAVGDTLATLGDGESMDRQVSKLSAVFDTERPLLQMQFLGDLLVFVGALHLALWCVTHVVVVMQ